MQLPYFTPTGGIVYKYFDPSPTTMEDPLLCDPPNRAYHVFPDIGHSTTNSTNQGEPPSLVNMKHNTGDAPASPSLSWDAFDDFSNLSAIKLIQRVTTTKDVEFVARAITRMPYIIWEVLPFRLAAAKLFSDTWDPACGNIFLDSDEKDVFLIKKYTPLTSSQTERPTNTTRGSVIARLYGSLFKAHKLTSDDFFIACDMLMEHHRKLIYIQGLWELLTSAGDVVCRQATLQHILAIQKRLKEERDSSLHDVEYYANLLIQLIDDLVLAQTEKAKVTLLKGKREQRRKPKLRKISEESRRHVRQLLSSGVY
ncbi:hypothetical protein EW145_g1273 [Phellinidium pouzarii]|uniref:Uncharacterized protein n=1 Tax=Phellinidium pouzarii TaxID=167371 RepID=A0A4S4LFS6_9AGAM|nr:hypothetical protein EW145_g1273 [Phellinidium pouzarii]